MARTKKNKTEILYSLVSGHNYYVKEGSTTQVLKKNCQVIRHVKTGERFYYIQFPSFIQSVNLSTWKKIITKPADINHFVWPIDIIDCGESKYGLVFNSRSFSQYKSYIYDNLLQEYVTFKVIPHPQLEVNELINNALKFINSCTSIYTQGYAYRGISDDNVFVDSNGDFLFDFSFLMGCDDDLFDKDISVKIAPNEKKDSPLDNDITLCEEFLAPCFIDTKYKTELDLASDYFSIAVIIFVILVGRLPFDGILVREFRALGHDEFFKAYHQNPKFIFDSKDSDNHITGSFAAYEKNIARWNALPEHIRNMFQNVFQRENATRSLPNQKQIYYSPMEWKAALEGRKTDVKIEYR